YGPPVCALHWGQRAPWNVGSSVPELSAMPSMTTNMPAGTIQRKTDRATRTSLTVDPDFDFAKVWKRYSRSGPGTPVEEEVVEQYLPLVRAVVARVAMS